MSSCRLKERILESFLFRFDFLKQQFSVLYLVTQITAATVTITITVDLHNRNLAIFVPFHRQL